jgi:hypothetical protein
MRGPAAALFGAFMVAFLLAGCGGSAAPTSQAEGNAGYGGPASASQRAAIAKTTEDFLAAEARGRWGEACALMASSVRDQLEQMRHGRSCPSTLAVLFKQNPAQLQASASGVAIKDARVNGAQGYVFYSTPRSDSGYLPLTLEGGAWKVATISGSSAPK